MSRKIAAVVISLFVMTFILVFAMGWAPCVGDCNDDRAALIGNDAGGSVDPKSYEIV